MADERACLTLKFGGKRLDTRIMLIFPALVAQIVVPVFQTQDHQHARDSPADLSEPSHACTEGGGHAHGLVKFKAALVRISTQDCLGAVGPAFE